MSEHAVIVDFTYGDEDLDPLWELEDRLITAIDDAQAGEFDGNELATDASHGTLYMYGPDADRLFDIVRPILESTPFMKGATATLQYGPPDDTTRSRAVAIET